MELSGHNQEVFTHEMRSRREVNIHNGNTNYTPAQTLIDQNHNVRQQPLPAQGGRSPTRKGGSTPKPTNVRYRECLRNHAAGVGGNVFDGCGEFMPSGEDGTFEALKCAACDCHRNFHRKEVDGEASAVTTPFSPSSRRASAATTALQLPPPTLLHHHHHHLHHQRYANTANMVVQPVNTVAPFSGGGTESSSEDLNVFNSNNHVEGVTSMPPPILPPFILSKKRFRTKFTQEQKDKMMEFAEKVGWRMNKQDEVELERFCAEIGVRRQVFKVWMHNNKNLKKQQQQQQQEAESQQQQEAESQQQM